MHLWIVENFKNPHSQKITLKFSLEKLIDCYYSLDKAHKGPHNVTYNGPGWNFTMAHHTYKKSWVQWEYLQFDRPCVLWGQNKSISLRK